MPQACFASSFLTRPRRAHCASAAGDPTRSRAAPTRTYRLALAARISTRSRCTLPVPLPVPLTLPLPYPYLTPNLTSTLTPPPGAKAPLCSADGVPRLLFAGEVCHRAFYSMLALTRTRTLTRTLTLALTLTLTLSSASSSAGATRSPTPSVMTSSARPQP